jgi:hypothetical protein
VRSEGPAVSTRCHRRVPHPEPEQREGKGWGYHNIRARYPEWQSRAAEESAVPHERKALRRIGAPRGSGDFRNPDYGPPPPASSAPGTVLLSNQRWTRSCTVKRKWRSTVWERRIQQDSSTGDVRNPSLRSIARRVIRRRAGFAFHPSMERSLPPSSKAQERALL